jgi:hypothetical protein
LKIEEAVLEFEQSLSKKKALNADRVLFELKNRVFPIHSKHNLVACKRYYYYLKQHNKFMFLKLNNELKQVVEKWIEAHRRSA